MGASRFGRALRGTLERYLFFWQAVQRQRQAYWKTRAKAIIRDGNYVWVLKGTHKDDQGDEIIGYYVRVYSFTKSSALKWV